MLYLSDVSRGLTVAGPGRIRLPTLPKAVRPISAAPPGDRLAALATVRLRHREQTTAVKGT